MSLKLLRTKYIPEKVNESFFTKKHIQVSEDGEHIFCQCVDSVTVVETKSGTVIKKISLEEDEVSCLALSPDGTSLTIGLNSSNVKHYKINDISNNEPQLLSSFKSYHVGPVNCMSWDSSSTLLATGGSDGSARVWDLKQKFCTHSLKGALGVVRILLFDKNLRQRPWVFGAVGENIFVWLMEAGSSKIVGQLSGHDSVITGLQLGHSEDYLISCGLDKVIILWDLRSFTAKKIIPVFESLSGVILKPPDFVFYDIDDSQDNIVFTIGNKGIPRIWNIDKGKEIWKADKPISPLCEYEQLFYHLSLVKATNSFVLTSYENVILFLHCKSMKIWKKLVGQNEEILDVVYLGEEDKRFTAVASNSAQIRVYENATNSCQLITGHTGTVLALANHPNDNWVFGSSSHDNTARVWRLREDGNCECLAIASGHTHNVGCLVLAKDFLITGSNDTCIKRWNFNLKNLSSKNLINLSSSRTQKAHSKSLNSVAVSKTFKYVATSSMDKEAKIWDANTLEQMGVLQGHRKGIWCVQFSPTDAIVATASADGTIKLWNLSTFSNISCLEGHEVGVMRLNWISQGQQILSCGADGIIKLWTIKTSVCVSSFDEHEGKLWALTTCDDGRLMITGASDSKLIWWRDVSEEEREKEMLEKKRLVEEEQILMNLLHEKKWSKALRYSLRLNQPFRGLTIMKALLDESPASLPSVLKGLRDEELNTLLEYVIQWNTKTVNVREAQHVLNYVLKEKTPEELEAIPNWSSILERLMPYTEKHFKRISALHQAVSILDYMTACISIGNLNLTDIDEKTLEEEETALLRTIPRDLKGTITIEDNEKSEEKSSESSEDTDDESFEHDNDYNDLDEMNKEVPLESLDDIRANFVYERVMAESDNDSNEEQHRRRESKEEDMREQESSEEEDSSAGVV